jgi:hypothetical protein
MEVDIVRHQAAIAGQVTEALTERVLGGARVLITSAPTAFVEPLVTAAKLVAVTDPAIAVAQTTLDNPEASSAQRLQAAQIILDFLHARRLFMHQRPDRTHTAADGLFFFIDLPDGDYTLAASLAGTRRRYGQGQATATVSRNNGNIALATADMAIPSTTVRGRITGPSLDGDGESGPVLMAAIQVRGSGEVTYSDSAGDYLLTSLEAGTRTVTVTAHGYQTSEHSVTLSEAGVEQVLNVVLVLPPPP